ncbi:MAG: VOC family protein [Gammaproteobacteria bacterium]
MKPHVRLARPVSDLAASAGMYQRALGLARLGQFRDHAGFDGVMLGIPGGEFHFEFTCCRTHPVTPSPTPEDLLVFYVPDQGDWDTRCAAMLATGFIEVASMNPYWSQHGRTFQDHDGYRVVLQCGAWIGGSTA